MNLALRLPEWNAHPVKSWITADVVLRRRRCEIDPLETSKRGNPRDRNFQPLRECKTRCAESISATATMSTRGSVAKISISAVPPRPAPMMATWVAPCAGLDAPFLRGSRDEEVDPVGIGHAQLRHPIRESWNDVRQDAWR